MKLNCFLIGLFCPLDGLVPLRTVGVFLLVFYMALELQKAGSWPIVGRNSLHKILLDREFVYTEHWENDPFMSLS
jgi:hypothetical protein